MKASDDIQYTKSSGNVYKDLGFKNAQERLGKKHNWPQELMKSFTSAV